ncbi:DUF389 domain-containing protein [Demetria terragena]|uniref:DUF389 domain-containing protein n=1 Tax=Demetria terragena TaxID=63959 RepID=UPI00035E01E0|nr:DUF389 domain-containing protein [Demetria terragena]
MLTTLRQKLLPESQRRTLEELSEDLEFTGDTVGKQSAFWSMLVLSGIIAAAGVFSDSTATVIGAMIIAPLSTPIMGIALAVVKRQINGSIPYVLGGVAVVVALGLLFSLALPADYELLGNSQISGRVSPSLIDLVAALGSGLAGALAFARRDVGSVLPGVAISISLVPPLVVVGLCLGQGSFGLAAGAMLLFVSNVVSLVIAGLFLFTVLGYTAPGDTADDAHADRTSKTVALLFTVVVVFLGINTAANYLLAHWESAVKQAADRWVADTAGAEVTEVSQRGTVFEVHVTSPSDLPPVSRLATAVEKELPDLIDLRVVNTRGEVIDAD